MTHGLMWKRLSPGTKKRRNARSREKRGPRGDGGARPSREVALPGAVLKSGL